MSKEDSNFDKELPDGWRLVRLEKVIREARAGFACGDRAEDGVIQLRMNNVDRVGNINFNKFLRVPADKVTISRYKLHHGDVLFNNTNSTELVGKNALFSGYSEDVVYSNHFTRLRTDENNLFPGYLALWLRYLWIQRIFENLCNRWIGQSAVKNDKLLALEIPLPSLAEQVRIASSVDLKLKSLERARAAVDAQLVAAKALPMAYLREVFESPEAQEWPRKRLGDLCILLPSRSISTVGDTRVQAITTASLSELGFQPSGVKLARMMAADAIECKVSLGEILVAHSNTPDLVGRVSIYRGIPEDVVASDLTIRIQTSPQICADFLSFYLSFLYVIHYWKERAGGASGSMKKITRSMILEQEIPLPSLEEQNQISKGLNAVFESLSKIQQHIEEQDELIQSLSGVMLRQAFNGEL